MSVCPCRTASTAEAFIRFMRSAPVKPAVALATFRKSMSSSMRLPSPLVHLQNLRSSLQLQNMEMGSRACLTSFSRRWKSGVYHETLRSRSCQKLAVLSPFASQSTQEAKSNSKASCRPRCGWACTVHTILQIAPIRMQITFICTDVTVTILDN